jgi:hypothetical protein
MNKIRFLKKNYIKIYIIINKELCLIKYDEKLYNYNNINFCNSFNIYNIYISIINYIINKIII